MRKLLKVIKWIFIVIALIIVLAILALFAAKKLNGRTPKGGINETAFVDINGTKQWINIYGEDMDAPVLLYIHGGPFSATSAMDWTCLRKLSRDYIVVNWDQRGCGHNYPEYKVAETPTGAQMMQDGREMTDYLRERFGREKITLMGFSWGSVLGSRLVLEAPEKYDAMIALSLVVDPETSAERFREYMLEKSENYEMMHELAKSIMPSRLTNSDIDVSTQLVMQYGYVDNYFSDTDVNFLTTVLCNPYCSFSKASEMLFGSEEFNAYADTVLRPDVVGLLGSLPLKGRTEYKVPFYLVEGNDDHGLLTMTEVAKEYYDSISAPDKDALFISGGHASPLLKTEQLAEFVHRIAEKQK